MTGADDTPIVVANTPRTRHVGRVSGLQRREGRASE